MSKVFKAKVCASNEYIVGPCLMILIDFVAATSLWASLSNSAVSDLRTFVELRLKQYQSMNGKGRGE